MISDPAPGGIQNWNISICQTTLLLAENIPDRSTTNKCDAGNILLDRSQDGEGESKQTVRQMWAVTIGKRNIGWTEGTPVNAGERRTQRRTEKRLAGMNKNSQVQQEWKTLYGRLMESCLEVLRKPGVRIADWFRNKNGHKNTLLEKRKIEHFTSSRQRIRRKRRCNRGNVKPKSSQRLDERKTIDGAKCKQSRITILL